jgi:hypothetical protein
MKKALLFSLIALSIVMSACKPEEQVRVEKVIAAYDCTSRCEIYDLVAQGNPAVVLDTAVLFVTRPLEDEDGYIALLGDEVYLQKDLSFNKSIVNYSLSGKFDGAGNVVVNTDIVDLDANTRTKCVYTATRQ